MQGHFASLVRIPGIWLRDLACCHILGQCLAGFGPSWKTEVSSSNKASLSLLTKVTGGSWQMGNNSRPGLQDTAFLLHIIGICILKPTIWLCHSQGVLLIV